MLFVGSLNAVFALHVLQVAELLKVEAESSFLSEFGIKIQFLEGFGLRVIFIEYISSLEVQILGSFSCFRLRFHMLNCLHFTVQFL